MVEVSRADIWYAYVPPTPKSRVYKFGAVWHWKCGRSLCAGGRSREWDGAVRSALEHVAGHEEASLFRQLAGRRSL